MREERRWFVGIDWASQEHVVSLCDGQGKKIGQRKFAHGGTGLGEMIAWLLKMSGGEPGEIHVASRGTPGGAKGVRTSWRAGENTTLEALLNPTCRKRHDETLNLSIR